MARKLVLRNGKLQYEEVDETKQGSTGSTIPALSPQETAARGGTPDQAKMSGTEAQINAAIKKTTKPQKTLSQAEKTQAPRSDKTLSEEQSTTKASNLAVLDELSNQVDELWRSKLTQTAAIPKATDGTDTAPAVTPALAVDQNLISAYTKDQQDAINAYFNAPTEGKLAELSTALGYIVDPNEFAKTIGQTSGDSFKSALKINPDLKMSELGLAAGSFGDQAQLASDFGVSVEELGDMTVSQIQDAIDQIKADEYNRVNTLRAELSNEATSENRRSQIVQQLRDLGQVGVMSTEAAVQDLATQVADADTVTFNGEELKIEDILSNEEVSNAIIAAVSDPESMSTLEQNEPDLAKWIKNNREQLESLKNDIQKQTTDFTKTQEDLQKAWETSPTIAKALLGYDADEIPFITAGELSKIKDTLTKSPIWNAASEDPQIITDIESGAISVADLANKSKDEILRAKQIANEVKTNDPLRELLGVSGEDAYLFDPTVSTNYDTYSKLINTVGATISSDRRFVELVKEGSINEATAAKIKSNPKLYSNMVDVKDELDDLEGFSTLDDLSTWAFGPGTSFQVKLDEMERAAKYDSNAAAKLKTFYDFFDSNKDGTVNNNDVAGLRSQFGDLIKQKGMNYDKNSKLSNWKSGFDYDKEAVDKKARLDDTLFTGVGEEKTFDPYLNDGKLDYLELKNIYSANPSLFEAADANGVLDGFASRDAIDTVYKNAALKKMKTDTKNFVYDNFVHPLGMKNNTIIDWSKTNLAEARSKLSILENYYNSLSPSQQQNQRDFLNGFIKSYKSQIAREDQRALSRITRDTGNELSSGLSL